jgi:hypothetical protein
MAVDLKPPMNILEILAAVRATLVMILTMAQQLDVSGNAPDVFTKKMAGRTAQTSR